MPSLLFRTFVVWIIVIGAEILQGIIRLRFVVRKTGDLRARQIGVVTGSILNFFIILACSRFIGASSPVELFLAGGFLCILTFAFEALFGHYVVRQPWKRIFADFDILHGGYLGFGFAALLASPWLARILMP
jgi:hypothetical protein